MISLVGKVGKLLRLPSCKNVVTAYAISFFGGWYVGTMRLPDGTATLWRYVVDTVPYVAGLVIIGWLTNRGFI